MTRKFLTPVELSGAPTLDLHAATKKYVDDSAGAGLLDRIYYTGEEGSDGPFEHADYPGATFVIAKVQAAGANGQSVVTGETSGKGGGGGGGYGELLIPVANLAASETVSVGTTSGEGSSFGTHVTANGGSTSGASGDGGPGGSATATGGLVIHGGHGSGGAQAVEVAGGMGGSSALGNGGGGARARATTHASPGADGRGYGAGGGGAASRNAPSGGAAGGAFAPGIVIVEVYGVQALPFDGSVSRLLERTTYGPSTVAGWSTTTTTLAAIDTTDLTVTAEVPASGEIVLTFRGWTAVASTSQFNNRGGLLAWMVNGTVIPNSTYTVKTYDLDNVVNAAIGDLIEVSWHLTDLTPGTTKFDLAFATNGSGDVTFTVAAGNGESGAFYVAPAILEARAVEVPAGWTENAFARWERGTDQSITTATWTTMVYPTTSFDTDVGNALWTMNTSTGVLTINEAGVYDFVASSSWRSAATGHDHVIRIARNGTEVLVSNTGWDEGGGFASSLTVATGPVQLADGDTIEVEVYQNSGGSVNTNNNDPRSQFLSAKRVG